jgi:hypothetical protein
MVSGFVAILVWLVSPAVRAPGRLAVITALAFTILAATVAGGKVTSPVERLHQVTTTSATQPESGSGGVRIETVKRALPRIADNPVVGKGFDTAGGSVDVITAGHSTAYQVHDALIAVWYEGGILALAGFLIVVVAMARSAWLALTAGGQVDAAIGLAVFAAFIAFMIYAMTAPFYFQEYGWLAGVLLIAWHSRRDARDVHILGEREAGLAAPVLPEPVST